MCYCCKYFAFCETLMVATPQHFRTDMFLVTFNALKHSVKKKTQFKFFIILMYMSNTLKYSSKKGTQIK